MELGKICKIEKQEDGILVCEFLQNFHYTVDLAWEIYGACANITNNQPYKIIWLMGVSLQPEKELFDFYADTIRVELVKAECFVLGSTALKMMANFYFRVKRPRIESKVFNAKDEALVWLKTAGSGYTPA